jgi:hypothetical protein
MFASRAINRQLQETLSIDCVGKLWIAPPATSAAQLVFRVRCAGPVARIKLQLQAAPEVCHLQRFDPPAQGEQPIAPKV